MALLWSSPIPDLLRSLDESVGVYSVFGDKGYSTSEHTRVIATERSAETAADVQFNRRSADARIAVECGFGDVVQFAPHVDRRSTQRVGVTPTALMYLTAVFFTNLRSCCHRNKTSLKFGVAPPSVAAYLACRGAAARQLPRERARVPLPAPPQGVFAAGGAGGAGAAGGAGDAAPARAPTAAL